MKSSFLTFVAIAVTGYAEAAKYSRTTSLSGQSFLDAFSWVTIPDPTSGRVNYVSKATAREEGLYSISGDTVTLRADHTTTLTASGPGRNSFRIQSKEKYRTHVAVFDIGHMPVGCGTWPAVWFVSVYYIETCTYRVMVDLDCKQVGNDWPYEGEIDIVEGTNDRVPNQSTLHTSAHCKMPGSRKMTGRSVGANCDVYATGNAGCGVQLSDKNSFGHNFNNAGGGWFAVERSSTYISIYFWERGSSSVPSEVKNPGNTVDPSSWGIPAAYFPDTLCNFPSHFGAMNIVINLDFCGTWAGATYHADGCPLSCVDFVNDNPLAFSRAFFEFNALNIYE